ncbi:glycohydrolase toxin TNT-related protein [Myceligenerans crystallogenes]|uniref:Papain fold toxin 1, glutamine deamidase n=1 Tax=Myceligenerans crystallogenes TaxID=316335 RepID=A0ABN2NQP4_9MICO
MSTPPFDPSQFPGGDLNPELIDEAAADLEVYAVEIRGQGTAVVEQWMRLRESYRAPEAEQLFGVMAPVRNQSHDYADELGMVARALHGLADDYRAVVSRRAELVQRAEDFNGLVSPEWVESIGLTDLANWLAGGTPVWHGSWLAVPQYNDIITAVNKLQADLVEVEERCARTIRDLDGVQRLGVNAPGLWSGAWNPLPERPQDQPWGPPVGFDLLAGFGFVGRIQQGVWVDGIWGAITDVGAMVGIDEHGWKPETAAETWSGMAQLLGFDPESGEWWQADAAGDAWLAVGKSLVAWDMWAEDPGRAIGNVGLLFVPGVGLSRVVKGLGAASRAGRAARALPDADAPDVRRPNLFDRAVDAATGERAQQFAGAVDRAMDPLSPVVDAGFKKAKDLLNSLDLGGSRGSGASGGDGARSRAGGAEVPQSSDARSGRYPDPQEVPDASQAQRSEPSPDGYDPAADNRLPDRRDPEHASPAQDGGNDAGRSWYDELLDRKREHQAAVAREQHENHATTRLKHIQAELEAQQAAAQATRAPERRPDGYDRHPDPAAPGGVPGDGRSGGDRGLPDTDAPAQDGGGSRPSADARGGVEHGRADGDHGRADGDPGDGAGGRRDGDESRGDGAPSEQSPPGDVVVPDPDGSAGREPGTVSADPVAWRSPDERLSLSRSQVAAADEFLDGLRDAEPALTRDVADVVGGFDGARLDDGDRVKPAPELYGELASGARRLDGVPARDLLSDTMDGVRYRVVADPEDFTASAQGIIDELADRGYRPVGGLDNGWGRSGAPGITSHWMDPDGNIVSVEFHTPESLAASRRMDDLLGEWLDPDTTPERRAEIPGEFDELGQGVGRPDGAGAVDWPEGNRPAPDPGNPWHDGSRARELASEPPGGSRPAVHAGSMTPEQARDFIANEMPWFRDVNANRYDDGVAGFRDNCTRAALAGDLSLGGKDVLAAPSAGSRPITELSDRLGGQWHKADGPDAIIDRLDALGEGSRGVVGIERADGRIGHVINVVNHPDHGPVFLDPQTGELARLRPGDDLYFLETAPGSHPGADFQSPDAGAPGLDPLTRDKTLDLNEAAGKGEEPTPEDLERARQDAERKRQEEERAQQDAERERQDAERERQNRERARQDAEREGQDKERAHQDAERERQDKERAQQDAERERQDAERARQLEEQAQQDAERARQDAERAREDEKRGDQDEPASTAEERARQDAERERQDAERARQDEERARQLAERERQDQERAEQDADRAEQDKERAQQDTERDRQDEERERQDTERAEQDGERARQDAERALQDADPSGGDPAKIHLKSALNGDQLIDYLKANAPDEVDDFMRTDKWPDDVSVPRDMRFMDSETMKIDWERHAPRNGFMVDVFEIDPVTREPVMPKRLPEKGEIFDRYGTPDGRFVSPVRNGEAFDYDERSLPYIEDPRQYHQYEVVGDFSNLRSHYEAAPADVRHEVDVLMSRYNLTWDKMAVQEGPAAAAFGAKGGAVQSLLPMSVELLEGLGVLKELTQ